MDIGKEHKPISVPAPPAQAPAHEPAAPAEPAREPEPAKEEARA